MDATESQLIMNKKPFPRFAALAICLSACSCMVIRKRSYDPDGMPNENHAANHKDFTMEEYRKTYNGRRVVMHYKVGDRFRLKQWMFLCFSAAKVVQLRDLDDTYVPSIENYRKNPEAYRYGGNNPYQVIKIVPAGTVVEIVKMVPIDFAPHPYFIIQGDDNWFRCATFAEDTEDYSAERVVYEWSYDRYLFKKL